MKKQKPITQLLKNILKDHIEADQVFTPEDVSTLFKIFKVHVRKMYVAVLLSMLIEQGFIVRLERSFYIKLNK